MVIKTSVLKELEENYRQSGNRVCLLYGRADSNQEELIQAFLKGKIYFYYRARQAAAEEQQRIMGREIKRRFSASFREDTYEEYFRRVRSGGPEKLVLVIDEFHLIAKKSKSFMEAVLKLRTKKLYPGPVMILLLSSAVAWVEKESAECFGEAVERKVDARIKLANLNFLEVVRALPEYSVSDSIGVYGVVGGVPGYISRWDAKTDLKSNILRLMLSRDGYLSDAAEQLIGSQLRELSVYETILSHIASGCDKLNDLYLTTGFSRAKISVYMKNLAAFDIIQKVVSFETGGWENTQKGIYRIRDNFVNFWFHFIYPNLSDYYQMSPEQFYDVYIENGLQSYLARYFKEVCMEYLELLNLVHKLPLHIKKMGTWIGKAGDIDIIAQNEIRQNIVGICNWEQKELTFSMCEELFANMKRAKIGAEYYFLFSAKGFDETVKEAAKQDKKYVLVDMNEL